MLGGGPVGAGRFMMPVSGSDARMMQILGGVLDLKLVGFLDGGWIFDAVAAQICSAVDSTESLPSSESGHEIVHALSNVDPDDGDVGAASVSCLLGPPACADSLRSCAEIWSCMIIMLMSWLLHLLLMLLKPAAEDLFFVLCWSWITAAQEMEDSLLMVELKCRNEWNLLLHYLVC
ncbi:hypothetical protein Nepgr_016437 [Nepenthes gracilis]|uniref:Uncharacterized protein n=1 Tax=Nepenthes gracilis TaxID=150966 RepID=A0AAD3XSA9_NEPGR|nr:hypothetical protein Nepgr_016437 [Nepenthes gracilis]